jgi:hypothetical protein
MRDEDLARMLKEIDIAAKEKQTEIMEWTEARLRFLAIRDLKNLLREFRESIRPENNP